MKFTQPFFYICTGRSLIGFLFKGGRIFEVIWVFVSSTWSSKITVTKEKRRIEEKERKRREKKTMVGSWSKHKKIHVALSYERGS